MLTAQSAQQLIEIQHLIPGETYSVIVPEDPALGDNCRPGIKTVNTADQTVRYDEVARQLVFVAAQTNTLLELDYACSWEASNPPRHYVTVACVTCKKKDVKSLVESVSATLEVQGGASAEQLVKDVLIGGDCFDITGVTFLGNPGQIGTFSNGTTNIGFNTGIIMATGDVSVAPGPNDSDGASAGYGVSTPDADLAALTGGALFDRASIEFDFTPTQTPVTFNFVFASEEYCEYVGTQFNDVFGFFISGPGIPGGQQNLALIPATNIPIAINNVNHASYAGYYVNNQPASSNDLCGQKAATGQIVDELQYDGFTRKFTAVANVQVCQTYHIKLKISDVGDGVWDSAVFLNAGSFDAGGNASVEWVVNGVEGAEEVVEGCGTVQLVFKRVGGNINIPLPVQYTVTGTATPGLDYTAIPPVVVIPAGQTSVTLTINITNDLLAEGIESVIVKLTNACSCLNPEDILLIKDLPPLVAVPDTVTICGAGAGTVSVAVPSGVEPYTYAWQNGSNEATATVFVGASSNVRVTVTDACGKTTVATARIIVHPLPIAQLLPPAPQICEGQDAILQVKFIGSGPFDLEYSLNGDAQPPITGITSNPFFMTVNEPGLYQVLSVTDEAGCLGAGQGLLLVQPSNLLLTGVATNVQCASAANGSISTTVTGGKGPYTFTWTGPVPIGNTPNPTNLPAGNYALTVTDSYGCTKAQQFSIIAPNALTTTIAGVQGTNCSNPNAGSINLQVSGGFPNYTYKWNNALTVQNPQNLTAGTYTVTVTDQSGCSKTITATVPGDFTPPIAAATASQPLTCTVTSITLDGSASSIGPNFTYNWLAGPGNIVSGNQTLNPAVNQAGTYTLVVTNTTNGCTATATAAVTANTALPAAEAGPTQNITCAVTNITLDGTGSSSGSNFTYNWTASPGGTIVSGHNTLAPVVSTAGTYTLLVTNTVTGCTKTDNVVVGLNITAPTAVIAPPGTLTCTVSLVTLNGSATPAGGTYAYQWSTVNGNIQSGQASANPVVTEAGDYTLMVTNTQNGCTDDASVYVALDFTDPTAVVVVNSQITCINKTVTINGNGTSNGTGYNFFWTATGGGNIVSGSNTLTPVVDAPGFYSVIVTNLVNNCTASASVQVTKNVIPPIVNPGEAGTLTCNTPMIELGDPATIVLPFITYQWTTSTGHIVTGANTPSITLDEPGTYHLVVTNTQNGCTSTGSTLISENTTLPNAVATTPGQLNCVTPTLLLNGAGSSTGANVEYQWSTTNGTIAAGGGTLTPTVTQAGTYTLTVTNQANGCSNTASVTVTVNLTPPTVTVAQPGLITCMQPQITLNGTGTSTGNEFKYQWGTQTGQILTGAGTLQPVVGQAGVYTLIVTNTTNSCTASTTASVSADIVPPVSNAGTPQTLNCQLTSLALDGSGSSQGAVFTYQWTALNGGNIIPPANILSPVVNEPGTYQLVVTNTQNGCTTASTVDIQQDAASPVTLIAAPGVLNCLNSTVVLSGAGSSTGNNFSYQWSGPGIVSGGGTLNATIDKPGDYSLVITNSNNNCTTLKTVNVTQNILPPLADAGADNIINCYQPQLEIGGAGSSSGQDFTYSWAGPGIVSGGNSAHPVVDQPGAYTLVITNTVNGCTATDNVALAFDQTAPQADAGPGFQLNCTQTSYILSPTASQGPDFTYKWTTNTGNFVSANDILNPEINGVGFYFLVVTNTVNGCTATDQVQITRSADFPKADAGSANALTCATLTITLNGGQSSVGPQFGYVWTTPGGGNIVSGANSLNPVIDQPGTYQLAVLDSTNSCLSYSSVIVNQDIALPAVEAGNPQTLTCSLSALTLTGKVSSNGNFIYNWQASNGGNILSGANTLSPVVSAVGTYTFNVTNTINGCSAADDVAVLADQNAPVIQVATPAILTCNVKEVTLDANGSTVGANVQYIWTTTDGNFTSLIDPVLPRVDKPGTYKLTIWDNNNGCSTTYSVPVGQDIKPPVAEAGFSQTLTCALTAVVLNGSNSSQNGPYFYSWTSPNGVILAGANTLTPTVAAPGGYALSVLNTDNGCASEDQVLVLQNIQEPVVVIATAPVITCSMPQVTLNGNASSIGPNFSYAWTTINGNITSGQDAIQAKANASGMYTLTVLNNVNGCSNTADVQVTENTVLPTVEAGPPYTLTCSIENVTLQAFASAGSQFVYAWSTSGGKIVSGANSLTPKVDKAGVYTLLVTNANTGCQKSDDVEVFQETNIPTNFVFEVQRPSCKDNDGMILFEEVTGGVGPYLFSIDDGQSFSSQVEYQNVAPGTYTLWIQDLNGCEFHKKLTVPEAPDPYIKIDPEFFIQLGDSMQLVAVLPSGYSYALIDSVLWAPLEGLTFAGTDIFDLLQPWARPHKPTEYTITLVSKDGCRSSDRTLIRVDNEPHVYIPNAFSPWDEDAHNDVVYISAKIDQVRQINSFQIFDRWGTMVFRDVNFQPNDPKHGWNGFFHNKLMDPAVFVYYAEIELIDGRTLLYKGDITLVR